MSRLLLLLFLYVNYVFCISYNDYSESSASSEEEVAETKKHRLKGCVFKINKIDHPLVLKHNTLSIIQPRKHELVYIRNNQTINFACPGARNSVVLNGTVINENVVSATCDSRIINDNRYSWREVTCKKDVAAGPVLLNKTCGSSKGIVVDVGFSLGSFKPNFVGSQFISAYKICFNEKTLSPIYTYYILEVSNKQRKFLDLGTIKKDRHLQRDLKASEMHKLYAKRVQRGNINAQLGLNKSSNRYINIDNRLFFSPGLLTSPRSFLYTAFKEATYRYINTAPQWNGLINWEEVEHEVITYYTMHDEPLEIWTGAHGNINFPRYSPPNTTRPKTNLDNVKLFMYVKDNKKLIPIPEFFWKLVYYTSSQTAVVFIVLNNPYIDRPKKICVDVTSTTGWLIAQHRENLQYGYSYTCSYEEFKLHVPSTPDLNVKGLLNRFD